jgi:hypothetical protein
MPPRGLLTVGRAEVASYGGRLIDDTVVSIEPGFQVRLANAAHLRARRILVATGLRDELPDVPGVRERWGRDLLHCPYCHGYEVRDQPLGVLEGGPEAVQDALLVRQWSPDVTLFPHADALTPAQREHLTARGIRIVEGTVARMRSLRHHVSRRTRPRGPVHSPELGSHHHNPTSDVPELPARLHHRPLPRTALTMSVAAKPANPLRRRPRPPGRPADHQALTEAEPTHTATARPTRQRDSGEITPPAPR